MYVVAEVVAHVTYSCRVSASLHYEPAFPFHSVKRLLYLVQVNRLVGFQQYAVSICSVYLYDALAP